MCVVNQGTLQRTAALVTPENKVKIPHFSTSIHEILTLLRWSNGVLFNLLTFLFQVLHLKQLLTHEGMRVQSMALP